MSRRATPLSAHTRAMPAGTASVGSAAEGVLAIHVRPVTLSASTRSVNVPPASTASARLIVLFSPALLGGGVAVFRGPPAFEPHELVEGVESGEQVAQFIG